MKKITLLIFTLMIGTVTFAQSNITFSVDMAGQTFTQPYVSGNFNSWSGDANALVNTSGTIWEITLPLMDGEYEYKFTYDNWTGQDTFTQGDVCTITNYNNTNRRLVVSGSDMVLPTAMFNECAEDSDGNNGPHSVTFSIDMNGYGGTLGTVYLNGENYNGQGLGNWCGACGNELTDMGGGIWQTTLMLEEYAYQFKFTVDGWNDQEGFNPGDEQTATDGTFTNRYIRVDGDKSVNFVWNAPQQTLSTSDEIKQNITLSVYPNPSTSSWNIKTNNQTIDSVEVFDILGKQVIALSPNASEVSVEASGLNDGIYLAKITSNNNIKTVKLVKN